MAKGWLEFQPQWLGYLFHLKATGRARVDMETGTILIEVEDQRILTDGCVLEGLCTTFPEPVTIATGVREKGKSRASV